MRHWRIARSFQQRDKHRSSIYHPTKPALRSGMRLMHSAVQNILLHRSVQNAIPV